MSEWQWELVGLGAERLVVRRVDEAPDDAWDALSPETAVFQLRLWLTEPRVKWALVEMVASLGAAALGVQAPVEGLPWALEDDLARAFRRRDLVVFSRSAPVAAATVRPHIPVRPQPGPVRPPVPVEVVTWVELLVVNEGGEPMPGVAYRITLPDGIQRTGVVDRFGLVRLEGVDPGSCVLELPEVDGREWSMG